MGSVSGQGEERDSEPRGWPSPRLWGPAVFRVTREPRPLPQSAPLTFTSETGGKHLLVGRGLMVATRDSTAMFSAARDGLGAGTTSSALSAP